MSENNLSGMPCLDAAPTPDMTYATSTSEFVPEPVEQLVAEDFSPVEGERVVRERAFTERPDEAIRYQQDALDVKTAVSEPVAAADSQPPEPLLEGGFRDLSLSQEVQQAVQVSGYEQPTPIQTQIIPHMLAGRDILAQSQTGSGKTAAFALPILSRIEIGRRKPQVLVLTPTRELAIQVAKSFCTYASCLPGFTTAAIYGGQDYEIQFRHLRRGVQVVVGTPGRVIDHINRGTLDLSGIDCLVLDEADEMLNMGFLEDVLFVLEKTPAQRQIALFSATLPAPIRNIAQRYLKDPVKITIQQKTMTAESIRQRAVFVTPREKIDVLTRILEAEETDGVIVFMNTKDATVVVAEQLIREGLSAIALNGDMPQKVRERTLEQLKAGHLDILVATDVAARGLDVTRVSHVFNFDLPQDGESYIHRVGRTGRAGRKGEAIIFLTKSQHGKLRLIEKVTKQPIEIIQPPTADEINAMRIKRFKQQITDMTADQDLTMFKEMIGKYAEESGKPMLMIAAALAQIGQGDRPFFMKDRPRRAKRGDDKGRDEERSGGNRIPQSETGSFGQRPRRGGKAGGPPGPPEPGMNRYRIEVGHRDGVKPGNIVGAVANEAGIEGQCIGPIQIHDSYSTIDLPEGMPREIYQTLQKTRVAGKQLRLSLASEHGGHSRPHHSSGLRDGKPSNTNGHDSKTFVAAKGSQAGKRKRKKAKAQPQN